MANPGKKKKKQHSSGDEKSPGQSRTDKRNNSASARDRSVSNRRKTVEDTEDQHKITKYTRQADTDCGKMTEGQQHNDEGEEQENESHCNDSSTEVILAKLEVMNKNINTSKDQHKQVDVKLERILHESFEIRKENLALRKKVISLEKEVEGLSDEVSRLEKRLKEEKENRNTLEQYTRKENIKISNLQGDKENETAEETEKLVLNLLHKELQLTSIKSDDISIAHRIGPFRKQQNRPVIVKFVSRKTKTLIMKNKKNLRNKHSQVFINEDLTKLNFQRLGEIKRHAGVLSGWSYQGKLYCKLISLQVIAIEDGDIGKIDRIMLENPPTQEQLQQYRQSFRGGRGSGRGTMASYGRNGSGRGALSHMGTRIWNHPEGTSQAPEEIPTLGRATSSANPEEGSTRQQALMPDSPHWDCMFSSPPQGCSPLRADHSLSDLADTRGETADSRGGDRQDTERRPRKTPAFSSKETTHPTLQGTRRSQRFNSRTGESLDSDNEDSSIHSVADLHGTDNPEKKITAE